MNIPAYVSSLKLLRLLDQGIAVQTLLHSALQAGDASHVLMRMAQLYDAYGDADQAWQLMHEALGQSRQYHMEADQAPASLRMLVVLKAGFSLDNTPFEFLIEGTDIACELLYVTEDHPLPALLPEHDLVFVAIGHFERHRGLFERVLPLLQAHGRPVLNLPRPSSSFERDRLSSLLQGIPGTHVPPTQVVERRALAALLRAPGMLPAIIRPLRSQAGLGLRRLESDSDVADYLANHQDDRFYLAPYVDYQSADGWFRKCRVLLLQGVPYVCHLAIAAHWMVHYRSAGMDASAEKRREEARFMADSEQGFCARHGAALRRIAARIGIDYIVLDCAETRDGKLLIFEADNVSIVHAADRVDVFPYKQRQMAKVLDAFRALLRASAAPRAATTAIIAGSAQGPSGPARHL